MIIWIVRKHTRVSYGWKGTATIKAFEIFSTHATRKESVLVANEKNKKTQRFEYMVGKVELKEMK